MRAKRAARIGVLIEAGASRRLEESGLLNEMKRAGAPKMRLVSSSAVAEDRPKIHSRDDVDALIQVVRAHIQFSLRRLKTWTIDGLDEDDLVHEVLMFLLRDDAAILRSHDPSLGSWITFVRVITDSRIKDLWRRHIRRRRRSDNERSTDRLHEVEDSSPDARRRVEADSSLKCIRRCLEREVPKSVLETYMLRVVEELSYKEISQRQGISFATVNNRLFRCRKEVVECARQCGVDHLESQGQNKPEEQNNNE